MIQKYFIILTHVFLLADYLFSQNSHPIILIHGCMGWGRDEMSQYYYWGGQRDIEYELREEGYEVYTVSIGPISPNWDRAIEAFYQIKGGQVDYGNEKAKRLGIIQRPHNKIYNGFYPLWDADHPIHIISHSQGGQTALMLEVLLKNSIPDETSSLLSQEYRGWIKSITTLSAPLNGSTLVPIMMDIFPFVHNLAPWFGGIEIEKIDNFYNFDLEHWGVERNPGEPLLKYYKRISTSPLAVSHNICSWDLSPKGAAEFNKKYKTDPDVYYFSFSTYATTQKKKKRTHKPDSHMSFHLWSTALLIGQYEDALDSSWYENDGICNTISMTNPSGSIMQIFDGNPQKGIWQMSGKLHMDHQAIIGHHITNREHEDLIVFYKDHCKSLYNLR